MFINYSFTDFDRNHKFCNIHLLMKGKRLRKARIEAGLRIEDISLKMHKSSHTIKAWEAGSRQPRTMKEIQHLCVILNITVEWYLSGDGPKRTIQEEQELLALYSDLKDEQKTAILNLLRSMN